MEFWKYFMGCSSINLTTWKYKEDHLQLMDIKKKSQVNNNIMMIAQQKNIFSY